MVQGGVGVGRVAVREKDTDLGNVTASETP